MSFNAFTLTGCGVGAEVPGPAELDAFFASLRPRGFIHLCARSLGYSGRRARGRSGARRGHLLTLVLSDDAGECNDGDTKKTNDWYAAGFRSGYLPWVRTVVARFAADPVVGMWEPVKGATEVDALTLRTFYDVVGLIRRSTTIA